MSGLSDVVAGRTHYADEPLDSPEVITGIASAAAAAGNRADAIAILDAFAAVHPDHKPQLEAAIRERPELSGLYDRRAEIARVDAQDRTSR
jgi:hypothetical protein